MLSDAAKEAQREYKKNYREKMTPEAKEKDREYQREWRKKNSEKVKSYQEYYWERYALKHWDKFGNDAGGFDSVSFNSPHSFKMKEELQLKDEVSKLNDEALTKVIIGLHNNGISLRVTAEILGISHMKVSRIITKSKSAK